MRYAHARLLVLLVPVNVAAAGEGEGLTPPAVWAATAGGIDFVDQAQQRGTIAGQVTDAQTLQPLTNVIISLADTRYSTLTGCGRPLPPAGH